MKRVIVELIPCMHAWAIDMSRKILCTPSKVNYESIASYGSTALYAQQSSGTYLNSRDGSSTGATH